MKQYIIYRIHRSCRLAALLLFFVLSLHSVTVQQSHVSAWMSSSLSRRIFKAYELSTKSTTILKLTTDPDSCKDDLNRRKAINKMVSLAGGILTVAGWEVSYSEVASAQPPLNLPVLQSEDLLTTATTTPSPTLSSSSQPSSPLSFDAYYITPDETNVRSKLDKVDSQQFLKQLSSSTSSSKNSGLSRGGAIWLGEHHNSLADHDFQATFIAEIYKHRQQQLKHLSTPSSGLASTIPKMAIGLEQVQQEFQPILDEYVAGTITLDKMRFLVQWDKRWMWNFDNYSKIFVLAKELQIPLLALNVDSEDLSLVEKLGYQGLSNERLHKYIKDPVGFSEFAKASEFRSYVDYVIKPSYELHQRMGLLQYTMTGERMEEEMSFRRFLSGRILWDEAMSSEAYSWCLKNPGGLLIGLVGADHVKFQNGIPGRFARMAAKDNVLDCTTVVINPTLIDSRPSGSVASIPTSDSAEYPDRITLQLRYVKSDGIVINPESSQTPVQSEGVLAFSDYVVVT